MQDTNKRLPKRNACETSQADRNFDKLNVHPVLATNVTSPLLTRRVLLEGKLSSQILPMLVHNSRGCIRALQETQLDNLDKGSFPVDSGHLVPDLGKICIGGGGQARASKYPRRNRGGTWASSLFMTGRLAFSDSSTTDRGYRMLCRSTGWSTHTARWTEKDTRENPHNYIHRLVTSSQVGCREMENPQRLRISDF